MTERASTSQETANPTIAAEDITRYFTARAREAEIRAATEKQHGKTAMAGRLDAESQALTIASGEIEAMSVWLDPNSRALSAHYEELYGTKPTDLADAVLTERTRLSKIDMANQDPSAIAAVDRVYTEVETALHEPDSDERKRFDQLVDREKAFEEAQAIIEKRKKAGHVGRVGAGTTVMVRGHLFAPPSEVKKAA